MILNLRYAIGRKIMVNIVDCNLKQFQYEIKGKKIIAFGAGRKFKSFISISNLTDKVKYVVDRQPEKYNYAIKFGTKRIGIKTINQIEDDIDKTQTILLITNRYCISEILEQIDNNDKLDGMNCYICALMEEKYEPQEIVYPNYNYSIPKKIHYCWFGKNPMPDEFERNIESWKEMCPKYEIIKWDETNYDVSKNLYMKQAYEQKKWGFVSDYARLDIIENEGGIYLDTDVKVIKPLDDLLKCKSFMGFIDNNMVALGLGFGAVKHNLLIKELRDYYNEKRFLRDDGTLDMRPCVEYQYPVLVKYGFKMDNKYQDINKNILYPTEVFNPLGKIKFHTCFSDNTHTIHDAQISWESEENRIAHENTIRQIKQRMQYV